MSIETKKLFANLLMMLVVALGVIGVVYVAHTYMGQPEQPVSVSSLSPEEVSGHMDQAPEGSFNFSVLH